MRKAILIILLSFGISSFAEESEFSKLYRTGELHLTSWEVSQASEIADKLLQISQNDEEDIQSSLFKSQVEFYKGNYINALAYGSKVKSLYQVNKGDESFLEFMLLASDFGKHFKEFGTDHFIIRYLHPKDEIISIYAEEVLEKAYHEVGFDLDIYPDEQSIVEIYPDLESFTDASTLSDNEIKTTGVVGTCKFNRIMILSPRILPKGYAWYDTLTHEYTHFLVFIKSKNHTPVWLHEGIAKFEEKRWKDKKSDVINPFYETILAKALNENSLINIEKMHPSLAKLESAYEAQLAFAQAGTMIEFLVNRWGKESLTKLLNNLRDFNDYVVAIKKVTGLKYEEFYNSWIKYLKSRDLLERIPDLEVKELEFKKNDVNSENQSLDLVDINDAKARDYSIIGDLLRSMGRIKSASYEYEKAAYFAPHSPVVLNRLATTKTELGEYNKAEELLKHAKDFYPEYLDTYMNLGEIYLKTSNLNMGEEAFNAANSINPFVPEIHSALISIYEDRGDQEKVDKEKRVLSILSRDD